MAKKALTEADIAALAAGATSPVVSAEVQPDADGTAADTVAGAPVAPAVSAEVPTDASTTVTPIASDEKLPVNAEVDNLSATVQLLTSQLQAKDASLLEVGIKMAKLQDQVADAQATATPLLDIAAKSISNMLIALGGSAFVAEGVSAAAVLAEHTRVSAQFQSKFKAGGVAAVSGEAPAEKSSPYVVTNVTQAQINAVRGIK